MEIYQIKNLSFRYPGVEKPALNQLNLNVEQGTFVVICGKSGCGKTTLIRQMKTCLAPFGELNGEILFDKEPLEKLSERRQASEIGYVMQDPDHQIVTDKVWHELAFGLENLGYPSAVIRRRVAEMASFFGIQDWYEKPVEQLSGGQKQLLNLASVMAMEPKVLVLDEPTSQLDPIAAEDFLQTLRKINQELGTTVILAEHRLEQLFPMADQIIVMDQGKILFQEKPNMLGEELASAGLTYCMPTAMQLWTQNGRRGTCPVSVREGRKWLQEETQHCRVRDYDDLHPEEGRQSGLLNNTPTAIEAKELWFRYEKKSVDVVRGLNLRVKQGEWYCILGGNGTGKTTTLTLLSGQNKPYRGKVSLMGKSISSYKNQERSHGLLGVLPQNPQTLFVADTVEKELKEMSPSSPAFLQQVIRQTRLNDLLNRHPYDLSGGEQQRAALAKVLLLEPKILMLDEPTKGIDGYYKQELAHILKDLQKQGITILMVSHDIEFCASYGDTCGLFFEGGLCSEDDARHFFATNHYYTTAASRISRGSLEHAVTADQLTELLRIRQGGI